MEGVPQVLVGLFPRNFSTAGRIILYSELDQEIVLGRMLEMKSI